MYLSHKRFSQVTAIILSPSYAGRQQGIPTWIKAAVTCGKRSVLAPAHKKGREIPPFCTVSLVAYQCVVPALMRRARTNPNKPMASNDSTPGSGTAVVGLSNWEMWLTFWMLASRQVNPISDRSITA